MKLKKMTLNINGVGRAFICDPEKLFLFMQKFHYRWSIKEMAIILRVNSKVIINGYIEYYLPINMNIFWV